MYTNIETERLNFIRASQSKLRADNYFDFHDAIQSDRDPTDICQKEILPSSFTGGPRYKQQRKQDDRW